VSGLRELVNWEGAYDSFFVAFKVCVGDELLDRWKGLVRFDLAR